MDVFENNKIKKILTNFVENKSHVIFEVICEEHLAIFYPLPYFELEAINSVLPIAGEMIPNATKYQDVTFHWITIKQLADKEFGEQFLTAFDYQIICNSAHKLTANLLGT